MPIQGKKISCRNLTFRSVFEVHTTDYKKKAMELQQQRIEEMEKNSILKSIMSRNPDEYSSTFAIS